MNATPDFLAGASDQQWFESLFNRLLAPLDTEMPCGPPARHDTVMTEIRLLREEDDPSLPMGQWERPLKRADWAAIEQRCITQISEHSKDLQTVVWLVEAWMRQRGFIGLCQGLRVLDALLRNYWPGLYPLIEDDGDCDARLAPLEWLNETLSTGIQVHATLLTMNDYRPPQVSLADWERLGAEEIAEDGTPAAAGNAPAQRHASRDSDTPLKRAELLAAAGHLATEVAVTRAAVQDCLDYVHSVTGFLQECLREQAPRLVKLQNVLEAAHRVLLQMQAGQHAGEPPVALAAAGAEEGEGGADDGNRAGAAGTLVAVTPVPGGWRDRNEAYTTLEALGEYLARLEPHSPTPFLLRRAVRWGAMPLPEVLAEILREEGDLNRLINVLGLQT